MIYLNFIGSVALFFTLMLVGSILLFLLNVLFWAGPVVWSPLPPMEQSFEVVYSALEKDWGTGDPAKTPSKDELSLRQSVRESLEQASFQLSQEDSVQALAEEAGELMDNTQDTIDSRLIPAIESGALTPETLTEFAKVLGSPSYESLKKINAEFEKKFQYPSQPKPESSIKRGWSKLRKRGVVELLESILFGFGTAWLGLFVIGLPSDPLAFTRNQVGAIGVAGATLSVLWSRLLMKHGDDEPEIVL